MRDYELLAPAGDIKSVYSAINAGANAIYIGGKLFSARAFAPNFESDEIIDIIKTAHIFNVKIFLAINTLIKDNEFDELYSFLEPLVNAGLDAVIMQDLGAISFVSNNFKNLKIHGSTQLTASTSVEVNYYESIGLDRVVLARELSLDEICEIGRNTNIELECFVHGSMCYSYSGRCLMSSYLGGRSANRGKCAGPCRLKYTANNKTGYLISMRDMQTIKHMSKLLRTRCISFKIEGRMKKSEYVAGVISIYKKAIDSILNNKEIDLNNLSTKLNNLYVRNLKPSSYLFTQNDKSMITIDNGSYNSNTNDSFDSINKEFINQKPKLKIKSEIDIKINHPIKIKLFSDDDTIEYSSDFIVQESINSPINNNDVSKNILATGDLPFEIIDLKINLDKNCFVPVKQLKDIRRKSLNILLDKINDKYTANNNFVKKITNNNFTYDIKYNDMKKNLICSVETMEQLNTVVKYSVFNKIYISYKLLYDNSLEIEDIINSNSSANFYIALPYIVRENTILKLTNFISKYNNSNISGFLCRDLSEAIILKDSNKEIIIDANLYAFNKNAFELIFKSLNVSRITISYESSKWSLKTNNFMVEHIVYGYTPLMISANCIDKTTNSCNHNNNSIDLIDRKNKSFKIQKDCDFCYNIIRNSVPTCLFNYLDELSQSNINNIRFDFSIETSIDIKEVLDIYLNKLSPSFEYTLGHYKTKVE